MLSFLSWETSVANGQFAQKCSLHIRVYCHTLSFSRPHIPESTRSGHENKEKWIKSRSKIILQYIRNKNDKMIS